jgi:hypothetical protein
MQWNLIDAGNGGTIQEYQLTIETTVAPGAAEPLSDADINAILGLLQARGVLSTNLESGEKQPSPVWWTPAPTAP